MQDTELALERDMRIVALAFLRRTESELVRFHELIDRSLMAGSYIERELFSTTHRIRGTAALFGFGALSHRVEELEAAVRDAVTCQQDDATDTINRTQCQLLRVEGELSCPDRSTNPPLHGAAVVPAVHVEIARYAVRHPR